MRIIRSGIKPYTRITRTRTRHAGCGDTVTVKVEGDDEAAAAEAIQKFLSENV